ncbi:uncharacterized protein SPPG_04963 [Spizellomyces punctatus DAOM BR117]|uniref:Uncharacterized protein n=1 Tax=Spizellomyces punctatus (strain DAOM BR117) TaxID=645134 RepID=A0A0L0HF82_SPIPD|nr:uncharacterized protein SPPG_04963 [Spizellomyces punctatus DAOM BR117]KNC99574.1 hypothetical protein SPPG_04963 [Spizellomyces punctatus DAOM BR117]|eukprot:XP_016607614.1 hypothetical protein SPPG_04963 [Spizellomyces punctatus DAOM BR117]
MPEQAVIQPIQPPVDRGPGRRKEDEIVKYNWGLYRMKIQLVRRANVVWKLVGNDEAPAVFEPQVLSLMTDPCLCGDIRRLPPFIAQRDVREAILGRMNKGGRTSRTLAERIRYYEKPDGVTACSGLTQEYTGQLAVLNDRRAKMPEWDDGEGGGGKSL